MGFATIDARFSSLRVVPIDIRPLFPDGVRTQIKRAYEMTVCRSGRRFFSQARISRRRVCRVREGSATGISRRFGVWRVLFSFHTVEIS